MKGIEVQGKILVVDAISTNRIVLKVKLTSAFYQVVQADSVEDALICVRSFRPDLILTSLSLPDGSAADLCRKVHGLQDHAHLPILAVGSTRDPETRLEVLASGAFDVMPRPLDETLLLGRVRSLIRAGNALSEFQVRDDTSCALGLGEPAAEYTRTGRVALVGDDAGRLKGWERQLTPELRCAFTVTPLKDAMAILHAGPPTDAMVLALPEAGTGSDECLRLISALRASAVTKQIGMLVVERAPNVQRATTALDLGADDVMCNGFESREMALRLKVLLRRKAQMERVHQSVRTGLREVVHDPLTGLYNRRYAMPHLARILENGGRGQQNCAAVLGDMDHFKRINDIYGHASGDAVLVEAARRLRHTLRGVDTIARIGGEEFLIVLPGTSQEEACKTAERLCRDIGSHPFKIPGASEPIHVTMSFGLAMAMTDGQLMEDTVDALVDRADKALYAAKMNGRNRVGLSAPQRRPAA